MADKPASPVSPASGGSSHSPQAAAEPSALIAAAVPAGEEEDDNDDNDSSLGDDNLSSTASVASSILEYRTIQGRTFHSDRHQATYFTPNDSQQSDSVDITHHYLTILLDGKLHHAPIGDNVERVVDIGTGTGIWAIDFADEHPNTQVVGTDLSPIQPPWVPPNLRFEIDNADLDWTWAPNTFDFVHIRYLFGAIKDWDALFANAYRVTKPGGWVETCEADVEFRSDDGTTDNETALQTWISLYKEGGKKIGQPFTVVPDDLQRTGIEKAGFKNMQVVNYKLPVGPWPADPKLAEVGRYAQLTMLNDIEGYTLFLWNNILGWPKDEYQIFLMSMRKALNNKRIHGYMTVRYVYGQKPET